MCCLYCRTHHSLIRRVEVRGGGRKPIATRFTVGGGGSTSYVASRWEPLGQVTIKFVDMLKSQQYLYFRDFRRQGIVHYSCGNRPPVLQFLDTNWGVPPTSLPQSVGIQTDNVVELQGHPGPSLDKRRHCSRPSSAAAPSVSRACPQNTEVCV